VLGVGELGGERRALRAVGPEDAGEQSRRGEQVCGGLGEQLEELGPSGDRTESHQLLQEDGDAERASG
jgi:hypothetical protein